jgi:hypothetical protein
MKVHDTMTITKRTVDEMFYGEKNAVPYEVRKTDANYPEYEGFYNVMRSTPYTDRPRLFEELMNNNRYPHIFGHVTEFAEVKTVVDPKITLTEGIKKLMDFFTEFSFTPSFRFTNTFAYMACKGKEQAKTYVRNYFALMDSSYSKEVEQKIKSTEFGKIIDMIAQAVMDDEYDPEAEYDMIDVLGYFEECGCQDCPWAKNCEPMQIIMYYMDDDGNKYYDPYQ